MGETELLDELDALISILKSDDQKVGLSG